MFFHIDLEKDYKLRFDLGKFLKFENDTFDPLTSSMIEKIKSIQAGGVFKVKSEETRPDQISYIIYGDTQYWWVIMLYNDILDVEDIEVGMILNYPDPDDLDSFYFSLKQLELKNK